MSNAIHATIPKKDYRARRRRLGGVPQILFKNYFYELDELADDVWRAIDDVRSVEQIAEHIAGRHQLTASDALAIVRRALAFFDECELLGEPEA